MINKILSQLNDQDIKPITGMDATFLYGETPTSPMHVGSVAVIEGSLEFEIFKERIRSRLHLIPKLRQRLISVPLSIDYPYWVDDPNFDLDLHLHRMALPKPGSWKELRAAASSIFSEHLDKSRPLWSFTFIEGLDNLSQVPKGSVAIVSKIHHVAIDGMAGAGILGLLFDLSPKPPKEKPAPAFKPKPLPNEVSLMLKSTVSFARDPFKFPRLIGEAVTSSIKAGVVSRTQRVKLPTAPFTAPPTPINGIISARRKWNTTILSLARVKQLKKIMETTLNDVILAICSGALRRYFLEKGKLPHKPLVAMVPISTRQKTDKSGDGNKLSSMLIQLATNIEDPIERLEAIYENTIRGKTYQNAVGAKALSNMAEVVPFGIANQAARLYSRFQVAEMHNPVMNLTITNVPGPQMPLYLSGHKLQSIMGMAPIIDGMGLIIAIFSYNGQLTVSATSDAKSMPDLDDFVRYIRESANELEGLILEYEKTKEGSRADKTKTAKSDALFAHIEKFVNDNPEKIRANSGVYQFTIKGDVPTDWHIDFNPQPAKVVKSKTDAADVTLIVQDEHLVRIARGELDIQTAFIQGRLKVKGDMKKAMKLGKILSLIPPLS